MMSRSFLVSAIVLVVLAGCRPDLGKCDEAAARQVVYTNDVNAWPAYAGQALVESGCGGQSHECHSSSAVGGSRYGAPAGVNFDLTVLTPSTQDASLDPLRNGQRNVYRMRYDVMDQLDSGAMPPGAVGRQVVAGDTLYYGVPRIGTAAARAVIRNWLACGAPVIERTEPPPSGAATIGAVVPAGAPCPDPATLFCGGATCVDPTSDPANCGSCGDVCSADPRTCTSGQCDCPAGDVRNPANGACVNLATDPSNCGAIGNVCPPGELCSNGMCGCSNTSLTACSTGCKDTTSDAQNCATCGAACGSGMTCTSSSCTCLPGLSSCPSGCTDLMSDGKNCGSCGHDCTASGLVCSAGTCSATCSTGMNCNGSCVDVNTDPFNCGGCGNACPSGSSCSGGACVCTTAGLSMCNSTCVDTTSDSSNCGTCGNVCPSGATCVSSQCVCATAGQTICGSACYSTQTDSLHCGASCTVCPSGASCTNGTCACATAGLTACPDGCDDLTSTAADCGSCGHACASGQACVNSQCSSVSFSANIQPIFTSQCALSGCHTGRKPAENMSLDPGVAYVSLLGSSGTGAPSGECTNPVRLRVAPGAPTSSYLIDKLLGTNLCAGNQMPKIGVYLTTQQIDMIRAWIAAGAPNN